MPQKGGKMPQNRGWVLENNGKIMENGPEMVWGDCMTCHKMGEHCSEIRAFIDFFLCNGVGAVYIAYKCLVELNCLHKG